MTHAHREKLGGTYHLMITTAGYHSYSIDKVISWCTAVTYGVNAPISQDCSSWALENCRVPHQIHLLGHDGPSSFGREYIHAARERFGAVGS